MPYDLVFLSVVEHLSAMAAMAHRHFLYRQMKTAL